MRAVEVETIGERYRLSLEPPAGPCGVHVVSVLLPGTGVVLREARVRVV